MISLDATSRSLQVVLALAVTTSELDYTTQHQDIRYDNNEVGFGASVGTTSGTTPVTIAAAPTNGVQRDVMTITVHNKDTASATVTINFVDSGTSYVMFKGVLDSGDQVIYSDEDGWMVYTSTGDKKTA
jgi:hypothetical protein